MRVVFMGSPPFALPSLEALAKDYSVVTVVSQPDRPAGRGRERTAPATKIFALEVGLPVFQPERLRDPDAISRIADLKPEMLVVAAYGQILPQSLLDLPENGSLNVHASLLPRWRGAAPIQASIRDGDKETGVTIMQMDAGLDTGPIVDQRAIRIEIEDTGGALTERLSQIGAKLLIETIPPYLAGTIVPRPQDDTLATHAPMLSKHDGELDLRATAEQLARQIRAFDPWPGTFVMWGGRRLAVKRAHTASRNGTATGKVTVIENTPSIATREGALVLDVVQPAGKREMSGEAFIHGSPDFVGAQLPI
ncbi:MAG: methionyl-tRNA formyltransferase [Anaerolineales bacterium]